MVGRATARIDARNTKLLSAIFKAGPSGAANDRRVDERKRPLSSVDMAPKKKRVVLCDVCAQVGTVVRPTLRCRGEIGSVSDESAVACDSVVHLDCLGLVSAELPDDRYWLCSKCVCTAAEESKDDHEDVCTRCRLAGGLLMCDGYGCTKAYHYDCAGVNQAELRDSDDWYCPACAAVDHVAVSACPTGSNYARRVALKHQTPAGDDDASTAKNVAPPAALHAADSAGGKSGARSGQIHGPSAPPLSIALGVLCVFRHHCPTAPSSTLRRLRLALDARTMSHMILPGQCDRFMLTGEDLPPEMHAGAHTLSPASRSSVHSSLGEPLQRRCTRRAVTAPNGSKAACFGRPSRDDRRAKRLAGISPRRQLTDTLAATQAVHRVPAAEQSGNWQLVSRGGCCRQCGLMGERQWNIRASGDDVHMLCERCFALRDLYVGKRLDAMAQLGLPPTLIHAPVSAPSAGQQRTKAKALSKRARTAPAGRIAEAKGAMRGDSGVGGEVESMSRLRLTEMADHVRDSPWR